MYLCVLQIITFDYGMEEKNPIDHVRFYAKEYPNQAFKLKKDHVSDNYISSTPVRGQIKVKNWLNMVVIPQTITIYCQ